jgi:hypothetical protein
MSSQLTEDNRQDGEHAFGLRIMQNALLHRIGKGLDPLIGSRFQGLGFLEDASGVSVPSAVAELLQNPGHPDRAPLPDGPLVFIREENSICVYEVATLLFQPERSIRSAALNYLKLGSTGSEPWISTRTAKILDEASDRIEATEIDSWRPAGIAVAAAVREDYLAHHAGARQSLAARYQDGIDHYLTRVTRPRLRDLVFVLPPLLSTAEQHDHLTSLMLELANAATIEVAMSDYVRHCGFIPLHESSSAAALVERWCSMHTESDVTWDRLWQWALTEGCPLAKYHVVAAAVRLQRMRPVQHVESLWMEIEKILDANSASQGGANSRSGWTLFCEAASHFAAHIEALQPGQDGERVGCYAWWLAFMFGRLFWATEDVAQGALEVIVSRESAIAFQRWTIARSPGSASRLRYLTLQTSSIWTLSLIGEMRRAEQPLDRSNVPEEQQTAIASAIRSNLIVGLCADTADNEEPRYAFDVGSTLGIVEDFIDPQERNAFHETIVFRDALKDTANASTALERLAERPPHEQLLTLLFFSSAVSSSRKYDSVVSHWVERHQNIVEAVQKIPTGLLDNLLSLFAEFQIYQWANAPTAIPHMLTYVLENENDDDRARKLFGYILSMSVNTGIVSPIQRAYASKWRNILRDELEAWRHSLFVVGRISEPWVAARVRATCSAVSRLLGPRSGLSENMDPFNGPTS